jgi:hypothetical protein
MVGDDSNPARPKKLIQLPLQARRCGGKKYDIIGLFQMRNGTAVTFHPFIKITCLFEALLNSAIFTISSGITCRETAGGREAAPRALAALLLHYQF